METLHCRHLHREIEKPFQISFRITDCVVAAIGALQKKLLINIFIYSFYVVFRYDGKRYVNLEWPSKRPT